MVSANDVIRWTRVKRRNRTPRASFKASSNDRARMRSWACATEAARETARETCGRA